MLIESILPHELLVGGIILWLIIGLALGCYLLLFEGLYQILVLDNLNWIANWLSALKTLVSAIPLLGLLGTIVGLLDIFLALSNQQPISMSEGIAKALLTTQMGMLMAIPAVCLIWFLQSKIPTGNTDSEINNAT